MLCLRQRLEVLITPAVVCIMFVATYAKPSVGPLPSWRCEPVRWLSQALKLVSNHCSWQIEEPSILGPTGARYSAQMGPRAVWKRVGANSGLYNLASLPVEIAVDRKGE